MNEERNKAVVARFTPFGVTRVTPTRTLYELVPLLMGLGKGRRLDFAETVPVIVDEAAKEVLFSIASAPAELGSPTGGTLRTKEFSLSGGEAAVTRNGREVTIELR